MTGAMTQGVPATPEMYIPADFRGVFVDTSYNTHIYCGRVTEEERNVIADVMGQTIRGTFGEMLFRRVKKGMDSNGGITLDYYSRVLGERIAILRDVVAQNNHCTDQNNHSINIHFSNPRKDVEGLIQKLKAVVKD